MGYLKENEALQDKVDALDLAGVAIGSISYLPALDSSHVPEWIGEFLRYAHSSDISRLSESWPAMEAVYKSFQECSSRDEAGFLQELAIDLKHDCDYPFFVGLKVCKSIYSVNLDEDGNVVGCGSSWSSYSETAILAMSMEDAIEQATALGMANLKDWHFKNAID